jgi:hypothetical protein
LAGSGVNNRDVVLRAVLPPAHCEECGFDSSSIDKENAAASIRRLGQRYRPPLTRLLPGEDADGILRRRPDPQTWSALEYGAHVRDLIATWSYTLHRALKDDHPHIPALDADIADRTAADSSYNDQDPATVADEIAANAERMALKVDTIGAGGWDRGVVLGEEEFSALAIVQKVGHEGHHHLLDIGRVLRSVRGR